MRGLGNRKNAAVRRGAERDGVQAYPGSVRALDALRERGIAMAVVSSSRNAPDVLRGGRADRPLRRHRRRRGGDGAPDLPGKPAPDTFRRGRAQLGPSPARSRSWSRTRSPASPPAGPAASDSSSASTAASGRDAADARGRPRRRRPRGAGLVSRGRGRRRRPLSPPVGAWAPLGPPRPVRPARPRPVPGRPVAPGRDRASVPTTSARPRRSSRWATATSACAATSRRAATPSRTARSSTASTRRGRSGTPRRPSASRRSGRPSSTPPTPSSSGSTSTTSRCCSRTPTCSSTSASSTSAPASCERCLSGARPSASACRCARPAWCRCAERHLAVITFEVTLLDAAAPVVICSQVLNRQDGEDEYHVTAKAMGDVDPRKAERASSSRVLQPAGGDSGADGRVVLGYRCANSRMTLGVAADHEFDTDHAHTTGHRPTTTSPRRSTASTPSRGRADPADQVRLATTPRGRPDRVSCVDRCRRTLDRASARGRREAVEADQRDVARRRSGSAPTSRSRARPTCSRRCAGTSSSIAQAGAPRRRHRASRPRA